MRRVRPPPLDRGSAAIVWTMERRAELRIPLSRAVVLETAPAAGLKTAAPLESSPRGADPDEPVRLTVVSQAWSPEGRSLEGVLSKIDEAARDDPDLILFPQECVATAGESIPGPISDALAAKARRYSSYIVGNIREKDRGKTLVTSFLLDREGRISGTYRKSHKFPDEDMDLGETLPVFPTEFGPVAMRIGTDRHFPEIDMVYAARGARIILWSQAPEPIEDEHLQEYPAQGRAVDLRIAIACARYGPPAGAGWITNFYPPYCGSPIGRSYVIDREGQRIACTRRSGGVATATFRRGDLAAAGRSPDRWKGFAAIAAPLAPLAARPWPKRRVRVAAIEAHVGIDDLISRLDEAGRLGTDIACTYEFVWIGGTDPEAIARGTDGARRNLDRIRAKAREHRMYVLVAGVIDRIERNEAILYDRSGEEAGRLRDRLRPDRRPDLRGRVVPGARSMLRDRRRRHRLHADAELGTGCDLQGPAGHLAGDGRRVLPRRMHPSFDRGAAPDEDHRSRGRGRREFRVPEGGDRLGRDRSRCGAPGAGSTGLRSAQAGRLSPRVPAGENAAGRERPPGGDPRRAPAGPLWRPGAEVTEIAVIAMPSYLHGP